MELVRYKLIHGVRGLFLYDQQENVQTCLVNHPVEGCKSIYIAGVQHVLGDDGESLFPVPPEGGIFRL